MPRYFFHMHGDDTVLDEDGVELPDLDVARRQAVRASGEFLAEACSPDALDGRWRMDVADESGCCLFSVRLSVVESPLRPLRLVSS